MVWLLDGEKNVDDMFNRFDRIPACKGRTDGRTDILPRHSPRYAYASRGKTILKPRLYVGFSRRNKIPRCSAYDIRESNPVPASGL